MVVTGNNAEDKAGGDGAHSDAADGGENRETDSAVDTSAEDKARGAGDRQRGKRLFPYIFGDVARPRRAIGLGVQEQRSRQATLRTIWAAT